MHGRSTGMFVAPPLASSSSFADLYRWYGMRCRVRAVGLKDARWMVVGLEPLCFGRHGLGCRTWWACFWGAWVGPSMVAGVAVLMRDLLAVGGRARLQQCCSGMDVLHLVRPAFECNDPCPPFRHSMWPQQTPLSSRLDHPLQLKPAGLLSPRLCALLMSFLSFVG